MASSNSNTLLDASEIQEPPTHYKIAVNGCWRPALVKDQQQRLSRSFHQHSSSCLLKVGVPSPLGRCTRRKKNLTRETSIYVNARPAALSTFRPSWRKTRFLFDHSDRFSALDKRIVSHKQIYKYN